MIAVIHVVLSPSQAATDLPPLLRGESLQENPTHEDQNGILLGTQGYDRRAVAICVGGGYSEAMFNSMRDESSRWSSVPWLHHDRNIHAATGGPPIPTASTSPEGYGHAIVGRLKARLAELRKADQMNKDGVYRY